MSKVKYLYLSVTVIIIAITISPGASWGWGTHSWLADRGMDTITSFLSELNQSEYRNLVKTYAPKPDSWKSDYADEGIRHYLDYDISNGKVDKAVLSWTILLAKELQWSEPDYEFVAQVCGVLSHYVMDLSQPLHCTSNYNPWGKHSYIDGWLQDNNAFDEIQLPDMTPSFIDSVHNYTMEQIEDNYYVAENELIPALAVDDTREIDRIVKTQAVKGIQFFIDLVYTAKMRSNETDIETVMNPDAVPLLELQLEPPVRDNTTTTTTLTTSSQQTSSNEKSFTVTGTKTTIILFSCLSIVLIRKRPKMKA
ncbi:MAG: hypothetical protein ACFFD4_06505 [Candidatus Odinarchaeota archaeon]